MPECLLHFFIAGALLDADPEAEPDPEAEVDGLAEALPAPEALPAAEEVPEALPEGEVLPAGFTEPDVAGFAEDTPPSPDVTVQLSQAATASIPVKTKPHTIL